MPVITQAKKWLGTPYHHQGRILGVGVDCATLLCEVYHAAGLIPYIDPTPYPPDWHLHRGEERYLDWVTQYADQIETPQAGDVVLYRFGRCVSHAGIVVEWPMMIHAYMGQGCVLADGTQGKLANRLAGFWRLRSAS